MSIEAAKSHREENVFRLLADVGGTNARFALLRGAHGRPQNELTLATIDFPNLADAALHYLEQHGSPQVLEGAIAIASPVTGDQVKMTNHHWTFSIETTRQRLGLRRLEVINDFTALALALSALPKSDLKQVGGDTPVVGAACALIGPGTGLGVSGLLLSTDGRWIAIAGEGGHATLCATNEREAEIIRVCRSECGHVSAERLISGMGLVNLYRIIAQSGGITPQSFTPAEIVQQGIAASDPSCAEALEIFCSMLGSVAGNLALTLGARGGLYIGGGIVPKLGDYFHRSRFRSSFESKGRHTAYLVPIPAYVIHTQNPALLGAAVSLGVNPACA